MQQTKANWQTTCQLIENKWLPGEGKINHLFTITLMHVYVPWREIGTKQTAWRSSSVSAQARGNRVCASGAQVKSSE